jgi:hypothetical protein
MRMVEIISESIVSTYYHVTETKNLPSIMKRGLIPKSGQRGIHAATNNPAIYLFRTINEAEDGVMNWLGDNFDDSIALSLLSVTISNNLVIDDPELNLSAVMTTSAIMPDKLKIITNDF